MDVIFGCEKTDAEFSRLLTDTFSGVDELENFSFSGIGEILLFIVPVAALSVQVVDFILTHVSKNKQKGRVVVVKGRKYSFEGYTKKEIIDILKVLE